MRGELQALINQLNLDNVAFLCGTTPNVLDEVCGARLFVLSSDYEGMPNALIEAMCLGTPVISTDCPCGGPKELIIDKENGRLVPIRQTEALAEVMLEVLADGGREMAVKAKTLCNTLDENVIFEKWLCFITGDQL